MGFFDSFFRRKPSGSTAKDRLKLVLVSDRANCSPDTMEMIKNDILRDIILEEERVPSTNEFAKLFAINPATAAKGVNILVEEGILYKKRGIGMFVATGAKEKIMNQRKEAFYDNFIKALLNEAKNLGITKEELIAMISKEEN